MVWIDGKIASDGAQMLALKAGSICGLLRNENASCRNGFQQLDVCVRLGFSAFIFPFKVGATTRLSETPRADWTLIPTETNTSGKTFARNNVPRLVAPEDGDSLRFPQWLLR